MGQVKLAYYYSGL